MASEQDYYQILGVAKNASDTELKSAYRRLALQWHPDRNKSADAEAKFKEITRAYEILSDQQKRQTYDQFGAAAFEAAGGFNGPSPGPSGGFQQGPFSYTYRTHGGQGGPTINFDVGGFSDPFEIFEQFFGGGFTASAQRRARRATYSLGITFLEAAKGTEKTVEIGGKPVKIKIPAGVDDATRVRFADFDILVSVWPDKTFQRNDLDIHVEIKIEFVAAILGTSVQVPTIDGPVTLKIPAGTQPDTVMRLRERGIKDPRSRHNGDEYVHIKLQIPNKLTSEQQDLLAHYQETLNPNKKRSRWF